MKGIKMLAAAALSMMAAASVAAEDAEVKESKVEFSVNADVVSSYLWRGQHLGGFAVQPGITMTVGGFSFGAWGSSGFFDGDTKEFDWIASYTVGGFSVGLTDYYCPESWLSLDYFGEDTHVLEANLGFDFGEVCDKFALSISANTNLINDERLEMSGKMKKEFSTYIELGYPVESRFVNWDFAVGACVNKSDFYGVNRFGVINISAKASKDIEITPKFTLPLFAQIVFNPRTEKMHFVAGISF